jgi:hypothetical protein
MRNGEIEFFNRKVREVFRKERKELINRFFCELCASLALFAVKKTLPHSSDKNDEQ